MKNYITGLKRNFQRGAVLSVTMMVAAVGLFGASAFAGGVVDVIRGVIMGRLGPDAGSIFGVAAITTITAWWAAMSVICGVVATRAAVNFLAEFKFLTETWWDTAKPANTIPQIPQIPDGWWDFGFAKDLVKLSKFNRAEDVLISSDFMLCALRDKAFDLGMQQASGSMSRDLYMAVWHKLSEAADEIRRHREPTAKS